ncbi:hypothetical protein AX17_005019 [Amanita inopinata Kibby_2008]|nr:hypothetical protein AX17_005019 [Amanita inopinata Kibby_2008]
MSIPSRSSTQSEGSSFDASTQTRFSHTPSISRLYTEATEFEQALACSGCIDCPIRASEAADGTNGFANLVGCDLSELDSDTTISLPRFRPIRSSVVSDDLTRVEVDEEDLKRQLPCTARLPAAVDTASRYLEPRKLVDLLIEEFGSLTTGTEEEGLLLETDGCLIYGVIIVGVLHLTTHRLAFHASLMTSRPGSQQILKSGPALLHQGKCFPKRRVRVELTSDMLCMYRSSLGEKRSPPLRSILLAFIDHVAPFDAKNPTRLSLLLDIASRTTTITVEFDTKVSAQDWRREISGVLFLYRHHRREFLNGEESQEEPGIRINCPLDRIQLYNSSTFLDYLTLISLHIQFISSDVCPGTTKPIGPYDIQVALLKSEPIVSQLGYLITAAKQRLNGRISRSPIFLDLGPFSISKQQVRHSTTCSELAERKKDNAQEPKQVAELWFCPAHILPAILCHGYFVITPACIGFWNRDLTHAARNWIPLSTLESVSTFQMTLCRLHGLALTFSGKESVRFAFDCLELRNEAMRYIDIYTAMSRAMEYESRNKQDSDQSVLPRNPTSIIAPLSRSLAAAVAADLPLHLRLCLPKAVNIPREIITKRPPLHFVCLTIGSRGDVQPYIALGLGLKKEGHRVTIVTHEEYKEWIENFAIEHRTAGGDPGKLMQLSVENRMFSPEFFRKSITNFRSWFDQLLVDAWEACQDADVLLESPSAMAGVHIAEALNIPYFRTFTMPWTKTSEFPHPFFSPPVGSPAFNSASYVLFSNVMWTATSGQINKWRRRTLSLRNTEMGHRAQSKITYIYEFSQAVVPKPLDWGDKNIISGYWFLDNPDGGWTPPSDLLTWMKQARRDRKAVVYIGFGSITVPRPNRITAHIVKAVTQSGVRAIISKGWSNRMSKIPDAAEVEIPPECYMLDKVPHDWLFPRIDVAFHHGGAGTTAASLRAGVPTLIKPWFGDQYFWASRVQQLGAGFRVNSLHANSITEALIRATTDQSLKERAAAVGEKIGAEDGVHTAIFTLYMHLPGRHTHPESMA